MYNKDKLFSKIDLLEREKCMINVFFEKLYRYDRKNECVGVGIPFKKGRYFNTDDFIMVQNGEVVPSQIKVTSNYDDGSIRFVYVRFLVNLPGNGASVATFLTGDETANDLKTLNLSHKAMKIIEDIKKKQAIDLDFDKIEIYENSSNNEIKVKNSSLEFVVSNNSSSVFKYLKDGNRSYTCDNFVGPNLIEKNGQEKREYDFKIHNWKIVEKGPVSTILEADGSHISKDKKIDFQIRLTVFSAKSYMDFSYRIINTSLDELDIESIDFYIKPEMDSVISNKLVDVNELLHEGSGGDSTGCGDKIIDNSKQDGPLFHTRGINDLDAFLTKAPVCNVRTISARSNYKTDFYIGKNASVTNVIADSKKLLKEGNEHFAETLYGTFFADYTDSKGGVCVTIYQAMQNYPKAIKAYDGGICAMLVPSGIEHVVMQPGMAREQRMLLHFHDANLSIAEIDNISLIYQMPDLAVLSPNVYRKSEAFMDVFPTELNDDVEINLINRCDAHDRNYGMLNWGDSVDQGYTKQGRGNGRLVYSNNEYDYPHACALQFARTGTRRFYDYMTNHVSHWMDVDVCHYSNDPLRIGGMWEHTAGHIVNGTMVCSHEWVEGLIDYYHFTGDERGLTTALGIGENILKLLDTPMYAIPGEANARETGWALRALVALYVETSDKKWLSKCDWILDSFFTWEKQYGHWLAPYTDNTLIRVGFMISVAIGSVMRYYRVFKRDDIKDMILRAVDDLIENCLLDNGLFYYKELPSLARNGNNTLLLESLAIAFELTGDIKYLYPGFKTFKKKISESVSAGVSSKTVFEDAVCVAGNSTKDFAQSFIPLITYYSALTKAGIKYEDIR